MMMNSYDIELTSSTQQALLSLWASPWCSKHCRCVGEPSGEETFRVSMYSMRIAYLANTVYLENVSLRSISSSSVLIPTAPCHEGVGWENPRALTSAYCLFLPDVCLSRRRDRSAVYNPLFYTALDWNLGRTIPLYYISIVVFCVYR